MDGITITSNQWNELAYLNVDDVPLIYLLGLSASNWPNNCKIDSRGFGANNLKEVVLKMINYRFNNEW